MLLLSIFSVFLKFNLATLFNLSLLYVSTICLPTLSTSTPAPSGIFIFNSFDNSSIFCRNIYLLIIEEHPTDKHLSSAFVVKLIFYTISFVFDKYS